MQLRRRVAQLPCVVGIVLAFGIMAGVCRAQDCQGPEAAVTEFGNRIISEDLRLELGSR